MRMIWDYILIRLKQKSNKKINNEQPQEKKKSIDEIISLSTFVSFYCDLSEKHKHYSIFIKPKSDKSD